MMPKFFLSSLRFRLLFLVFLSVVPALGVVIHTASEQQRLAELEVEKNVQQLTQLAASNQDQLIEKTRQFLITLSRLPEVRPGNPNNCSELLADLLKQDLPFANFGVVELDGDIVCSARPLKASLNVIGQAWFDKSLQTNRFAVGDYQMGRITGKPLLIFSYPLRNDKGQIQAVIFNALDIAKINQLAANIQLPESGSITVIDSKGTVLARHPNPEKWVGKSLINASLIKTILRQKKGTVEVSGIDGIVRLYAFDRLQSLSEGDIYVTIGISKASAFAKVNAIQQQNLIGIGLLGLLMLTAAWIGSDLFILRQVRALVRATQQLAAGELGTRIGVSDKQGELNQLADAFDRMAATLQKRQEELSQINRSLRTLSDCNQALVHATEESHLLGDICSILVGVGGYRLAWVGFAEKDEPKSVRVVATAGYEDGYLELMNISWGDNERGRGPTGTAIRTGKVCISRNLLTDEKFSPWRKYALERGYASSIALPLMANGEAFGALNIYAPQPDAFEAEEVRLLVELAGDMAYGIKTLRAQQERDRIERSLRESEERYRQLVELCPDGIFIETEGKFVFVNREALKLFGAASSEELIGKSVIDFVHTSDREIVKERIRLLGKEFKEVPLREEKWFRLDGTMFYAEVVAIPFSYQGKSGAQVVVRDISQRKQAEEKLKKSEELYRTLARNFPNGAVLLFDKDLRYFLAEGKGLASIGLSKELLEGQKIADALPAEIYKNREKYYLDALAGIATQSEIIYGDRIFYTHTLPVRNDSGEIFAGMIMSQDITDRVKAENQLKKAKDELENLVADRTAELTKTNERLQIELTYRVQASDALRESEERFRSAFNYAVVGMGLVSPEGRWLRVNHSLCEIFGYSEDELLNMTFQELAHPDDVNADIDYVRQIVNGEIRSYQIEKRYLHKQGYIVWILLSISAVWDASNRLLYLIPQLQDITSRKRAEAALQASQARFAGILDIAKDAIISIDKNQRITLFNQGAENIFGYTISEVLGENLDLLLPWRFVEVHRQHIIGFTTAVETARKMGDRTEVFGRRKDGSEFPAEASISKLELAGEQIFTVILRDITDRKRAEEALSQLAAIVESSDDAIVGKNLEGIILSWNSGAQKIYGYSAEEVKGRLISLLIPSDHPDEMPRILEQIRQGKSIESYETVRLRKNGERILVSLTVSPIRDAEGKIVGASSIARDISDRKRVEAAIAHFRHQNELILNAAGDGIYGMDLQGKATFINLSAAKMLGYEVAELMGQNMHSKIHHTKPDGTPYSVKDSPLYKTFNDGSLHRLKDEIFWRKDGSSFPVEYVSTPILEQDKIVGAVVTFKDITERRAVEQMKDEFISVVSHELRTPLTSIRTSLGLLTSGLLNNQPDRIQWMLDVAMESTNRLVRLVNDILDIERIESGKVTMNKEICDCENLMNNAADVMQAMAEKSGIFLSVNPISVQLFVDPDRLIQTLTNLLSNAIKFSPPGSTVWLNAEVQNDQLLFQIKDQGRGIPADKLETIFGRFQQVDASDSRQQGGTGLGLAICRSILHQHGGRIWAESIVGEGSSFYFTLPILRDVDSINN